MQPALGPTLATAAAVADIRVGSWVYAAALRQPWINALEAHSLSVLTEGRFEAGIGAGRPGIETEQGLPQVPLSERRARMRETVTLLREYDGPDLHTPVVMAVRGPKTQALAADVADAATFVIATDDDRGAVTNQIRDFATDRNVELVQHIGIIGDEVAPFMVGPGADTDALRAADSLLLVPSDPAAIVEELHRRREEIGFSYFVFGAKFADTLAPVVAELAGR
jgi:hypothetical protein